jgi:hypothetical protein
MDAKDGIAIVFCMLGLYKQRSSHHGVASSSLKDVYRYAHAIVRSAAQRSAKRRANPLAPHPRAVPRMERQIQRK